MLKQASLWSGFQVLTISYHIAFLRIYLGKVKMEENFQLLYSSDGNGAGTGGKDLPVLPYGGSRFIIYLIYYISNI